MEKLVLLTNNLFGTFPLSWKRLTPGRAIRKGPWKLIYFFENHIYELYNLDNDIGERNNLAAIYPEKFEEMKKLLNVWSEEIKAKKPIINKDF